MKNLGYLFILSIGIHLYSYAQVNLIKNPSFEDVFDIPTTINTNPYPHYLLPNWKSVIPTPDLFSFFSYYYSPDCYISSYMSFFKWSVSIPKNCFGFQSAKDGFFYVGMFTAYQPQGYPDYWNGSERLRGELQDSLKKDHIYIFNLFWSFPNGIPFSSNQFQVFFSKDTLSDTVQIFIPYHNPPWNVNGYLDNFNFTIENDTSTFMNDTLNWVPLTKCFRPQGGEKYIYIGNFRSKKYTKTQVETRDSSFIQYSSMFYTNCIEAQLRLPCSYYFIDDLSLYDLGYYGEDARARNDTLICPNTPIHIGTDDSSAAHYQWFPPTFLNCDTCPDPIATPTITTTYVLKKYLCDYATYDTVTISVAPVPPLVSIIKDTMLCYPTSVSLSAKDTAYPFTQYQWFPLDFLSCNNCPNPVFSPPDTGQYHYIFTQTFCNTRIQKDSINIFVNLCNNHPELEIPNIFTPNNDGINDEWFVQWKYDKSISDFHVTVFNRWGTKVFSSNDKNFRWNGKCLTEDTYIHMPEQQNNCPAGTYFYIIEYTINHQKKEHKGYITLLM